VALQPGEVVRFPGAAGPAASRTPGGWLGLIPATIEIDWDLVSQHGPCVMVAPGSPARRAGMKSGDFVKSINDKGFAEFQAELPPPGSPFSVVFFRKAVGDLRTFGVMVSPPKPRRVPTWQSKPSVLPGRQVEPNLRPQYLGFVAKHPSLKAVDTRLLTLLIEYEWVKGSIPKHASLSLDMGCSVPTVKRSLDRCRHFGLVDWISGKADREANSYTVCWPAGHHPRRKREPGDRDDPATAHSYHPETISLAAQLSGFVGFSADERRAREAVPLVDSWLRHRWDRRVITQTVESITRQRRGVEGANWAPNSLKYFERIIRKNCGA
jgi:hypothetical protein